MGKDGLVLCCGLRVHTAVSTNRSENRWVRSPLQTAGTDVQGMTAEPTWSLERPAKESLGMTCLLGLEKE